MFEKLIEKLFGSSFESDITRKAKMESLGKIRGSVSSILEESGGEVSMETLDKLIQTGEILAKEKEINFKDMFSTNIVEKLRGVCSVQELALVLAAYVKNMEIGRMEQAFGNILPGLGGLIRSETEAGRFENNNEVDSLVVFAVTESLRSRMPEYRKTPEEASNMATNLENALRADRDMVSYSLGLIAETISTSVYDERVIGWRILENRCDIKQTVNVLKDNLIDDVEWGTLLAERHMKILAGKLGVDDSNRKQNQGRPLDFKNEDYQSVKDLFTTIYSQRNKIKQDGYWGSVISGSALYFAKQTWLKDAMPERLWNEIREYKIDRKEKVRSLERRLESPMVSEVENLGFGDMNEAFVLLNQQEQKDLLKYLEEEDEDRDGILQGIFKVTDSSDLDTDYLYTSRGRLKVGVKNMILDPRLEKMFIKMAKEENRDKFAMELALMTALIPINDFSSEMKRSLKAAHESSDQVLKKSNSDWYLCSMSEHRLLSAMMSEKSAVILINDKMLLKFDGKKSALCLESFTDPSGDTFVKGVWYAVVDQKSRQAMDRAFADGEVVLNKKGIKWAVMRSMSDDEEYTGLNADHLMEAAIKKSEWCNKNRNKKVKRSRNLRSQIGEGF